MKLLFYLTQQLMTRIKVSSGILSLCCEEEKKKREKKIKKKKNSLTASMKKIKRTSYSERGQKNTWIIALQQATFKWFFLFLFSFFPVLVLFLFSSFSFFCHIGVVQCFLLNPLLSPHQVDTVSDILSLMKPLFHVTMVLVNCKM